MIQITSPLLIAFSVVVILFSACLASKSTSGFVAAQRLQRTLTVTDLAIRPGTLTTEFEDMQALRLGKAGVFPRARMDIRILNATYSLESEGCRAALSARPFVSGPGWLADLIPVTGTPFALVEPSLLRLLFQGTSLFDARGNAAAGSAYEIKLPSSCTSNILATTLKFKVSATRTSQLAGIAAFSMLLASTVSFLAVLGGSLFAYVPVQVAVLLSQSGCSPLDLQAESFTTGFAMAPLPYASRDRYPYYRSLLVIMMIFFIVAMLETVYFLYLYNTSNAYAQRIVASLKGNRQVFSSAYRPQPGDKYPVPEEEVPKRVMPGYFLFCMFAAFGGGVIYNASRVLGVEAKEVQHYVAAGVSLVVYLIFLSACVSLSLTKGAFYKMYSSSKKKLPRVITPDGCTGPNVFRLSFGVVVSDMRQGRRSASTLPVLYVAIMAALTASSAPTAGGCRATVSLQWLVSFLFAIFIYRSQPMRSTAANVLAAAVMLAILFAISCLLVYAGYGGNESLDSASGPMLVISLIVLSVLCIFSGVISCIVSLWENSGGGEAMRCAKHSDIESGGLLGVGTIGSGAGSAGGGVDGGLAAIGVDVFERHVAFLVQDMKKIIEAGGGQPLEPDDTALGQNLFQHHDASSPTRTGPTLATFLLQDFDALPTQTQESLVTSDRISKQAQLALLRHPSHVSPKSALAPKSRGTNLML